MNWNLNRSVNQIHQIKRNKFIEITWPNANRVLGMFTNFGFTLNTQFKSIELMHVYHLQSVSAFGWSTNESRFGIDDVNAL